MKNTLLCNVTPLLAGCVLGLIFYHKNRSFETSVGAYLFTQRHILEEITFQNCTAIHVVTFQKTVLATARCNNWGSLNDLHFAKRQLYQTYGHVFRCVTIRRGMDWILDLLATCIHRSELHFAVHWHTQPSVLSPLQSPLAVSWQQI
jgi:hypothetical protein